MERDRVSTFEDMKVWQEAHALVMRVFEQTPKLPQEQHDGLAMAMEKAAVDVPRLIAEGFRRRELPRRDGQRRARRETRAVTIARRPSFRS